MLLEVEDLTVAPVPRRTRLPGEEEASRVFDDSRAAASRGGRPIDRAEHVLVDGHRCLHSHTYKYTTSC